jgi:hypothetical protein
MNALVFGTQRPTPNGYIKQDVNLRREDSWSTAQGHDEK